MTDYNSWIGQTVYDKEDKKVGSIDELYVDDDNSAPAWATVKSSTLFGSKLHFAPMTLAKKTEDGIKFNVTSDEIKNAPSVEVDQELSEEDEGLLFEHYAHARGQGDKGYDTSGPSTDEAMTRSEEKLHVGTEKHEVGRARLKKYIVTEQVHTTVPVQKEVVNLVREPITQENRDKAMDGPELSEEEHEVVLNEERVVVSKETVPVERVKLAKDVVTEETPVDETIRKEQIDVEGDKQ